MATEILIFVLLIIFVSSLVRATFGFGDALIAMPLLVLFIDVRTATPLIAFFACIIALILLAMNFRKIEFKKLWTLILFSILGIPLGLLFLKGSNDLYIKIVLAVILIIFSVFKLWKPEGLTLKSNKSAFLFGLVSGILGGAYNTNGPPIIIFGTMRKWDADKFRDMLQGIYLPTNIFIILGHGAAGLWTQEVFNYFLISIPVVAVATVAGIWLNKRIPEEKFSKYIYGFLILISVVLLVNTLIKT
ncbi:MAG: sulfite exporter TauE/SafE family protein [Bacteroidota bacterium]